MTANYTKNVIYSYYPHIPSLSLILLNFPNKLIPGSMPLKKFDFTICFLFPHLYVICGKDSVSEVTDSCERYNVEEDSWQTVANVNVKRYAASACGFQNNKIFLFGGRY
jgi:hypothetical protein